MNRSRLLLLSFLCISSVGMAQRAVDAAEVRALQQEYAADASPAEVLIRGRALLKAAHTTGNCPQATLGATLVALAYVRMPSQDYPAELEVLQLPEGCAATLPHLPYQLGAAAFAHGEFAHAVEYFEASAAFEGWAVTGLVAAGACHQHLRNLPAAADAYERAVAASQERLSPLLLNNLASVYIALHDGTRAREAA